MNSRQRSRLLSPDKPGLLVRFENHVAIKRSLPEVFAFVSDFRNIPKWNNYVRLVEKETEGPVGVGTSYHQVRKHDQQRFVVTEFAPPRLVTIETTPHSTPAFTIRLRLEPTRSGATLYDAWELDTVKHRVLARLLGRRAAREAAQNLYRLKELLEKGGTILQDGREVRLQG